MLARNDLGGTPGLLAVGSATVQIQDDNYETEKIKSSSAFEYSSNFVKGLPHGNSLSSLNTTRSVTAEPAFGST